MKFQHVGLLIKSKRVTTQAECGRAIGTSERFISNIERGVANVPFRQVAPLCIYLGIKYDEMIEAMVSDFEHDLRSTVQRSIFKRQQRT